MNEEQTRFDQFSLCPELLHALERKGFDSPSPVQVQVLKESNIAEGDLIVQAKTGSGKTLAFGLPLLNQMDHHHQSPFLLILSPTRELAMQTAREFQWLGRDLNVKVTALVGGMDIERQRHELLEGAAVVVGTPGRVLDHIRRGNVHTSSIESIVLDEGDHMLDMGFREELEAILEAHENIRRTWLFSATMPPEVRELSRRYLKHPKWITLDNDLTGNEDIKHRIYLIPSRHRFEGLVNVLLWEAPEKGLIFCSTRSETIECTEYLAQAGFSVHALHGEMTQRERNASLNSFRSGSTPFLVATDVAARGLDIDLVTHVIQLGLPGDLKNYVHRSGRTGRAGHEGLSLAILTPREAKMFREMFSQSSLKPEWLHVPDKEAILSKNQQRFEERLLDTKLEPESHFTAWAQTILSKNDPVDLVSKLLKWKFSETQTGFNLSGLLATEMDTETNRRGRTPSFRGNKMEKSPSSSFSSAGTVRLSTGTMKGWEVGRLLGVLCRTLEISRQEVGNIKLRQDHALVELSALAIQRFQEKKTKLIDEHLLESSKPSYGHSRGRVTKVLSSKN
ncbi:MAG: DEAD/DEAH box helicase [Candidatus Atribacteria bacterium]|nr:DEAD/DEAH box helicase [Candidatus Atribacteria bacterium]